MKLSEPQNQKRPRKADQSPKSRAARQPGDNPPPADLISSIVLQTNLRGAVDCLKDSVETDVVVVTDIFKQKLCWVFLGGTEV